MTSTPTRAMRRARYASQLNEIYTTFRGDESFCVSGNCPGCGVCGQILAADEILRRTTQALQEFEKVEVTTEFGYPHECFLMLLNSLCHQAKALVSGDGDANVMTKKQLFSYYFEINVAFNNLITAMNNWKARLAGDADVCFPVDNMPRFPTAAEIMMLQ